MFKHNLNVNLIYRVELSKQSHGLRAQTSNDVKAQQAVRHFIYLWKLQKMLDFDSRFMKIPPKNDNLIFPH